MVIIVTGFFLASSCDTSAYFHDAGSACSANELLRIAQTPVRTRRFTGSLLVMLNTSKKHRAYNDLRIIIDGRKTVKCLVFLHGFEKGSVDEVCNDLIRFSIDLKIRANDIPGERRRGHPCYPFHIVPPLPRFCILKFRNLRGVISIAKHLPFTIHYVTELWERSRSPCA